MDNLIWNYNKKGQITIILIIAIVIVGILIIFFSFREKIIPKPESKIPEISQINSILEECIEQKAIDAIMLIGLQGGYTNLPKNNIKLGDFNIAYGLHKNQNTLAPLSTIEDEISSYIKLTISSCIEDQEFPQLIISQEQPETSVKIKQDIIEISANLPLSITKADKSVTFDNKYKTEIPIRLTEIHNTANNIIQKHLDDPEFIDLTYLTNLDFDIVFTHYTETSLIYTITDEESQLDNIPYSFMFVIE